MSKKYYCDYCEKSFKDDRNIRKKHIEGLPHQKARIEHYAHFKSAREILKAEEHKKPCAKFPNGACQFGATCRFSHYTSAQLAKLRQQAYLDEQREHESHQPKIYSKKLIEEFQRKRKQTKEQQDQQFLKEFFNYPDKWLRIQHELPPSLRLIDPNVLKKDLQINFFG